MNMLADTTTGKITNKEDGYGTNSRTRTDQDQLAQIRVLDAINQALNLKFLAWVILSETGWIEAMCDVIAIKPGALRHDIYIKFNLYDENNNLVAKEQYINKNDFGLCNSYFYVSQ